VPDHCCLDLLHWDLHLPIAWADTGDGVLGQVADDLLRCALLGGVERRRHLRLERGRERPGLRPVDRNLDEPQSLCVLAQSAFRLSGLDDHPGDPAFVGLAAHAWLLLEGDVASGRRFGDEAHRDPVALGEVVVVVAGATLLDLVARGLGAPR
jgi:hypothetical protein